MLKYISIRCDSLAFLLLLIAALVVLTAKNPVIPHFKADIPWGRGARILVTFFIPDEFASLCMSWMRVCKPSFYYMFAVVK